MCQKKIGGINLLNTVNGNILLSTLRNKDSSQTVFRDTLKKIGILLANAVSDTLPTKNFAITTPMADAQGHKLANKVVLIPILRAGLGMLPGFLYLFDEAMIGPVGYKRSKVNGVMTAKEWQWDVAKIDESTAIIVVDPMIATGTTARAVLTKLRKSNPHNPIYFTSVIMSQESATILVNEFPQVHFWTVAVDEKMNADSYIVPGLGDAGERLFHDDN